MYMTVDEYLLHARQGTIFYMENVLQLVTVRILAKIYLERYKA